mmetsp:Transcript_39500/g.92422  ORF Transcript_39500/g.92422 Transcript_39500/m.92422 type:complete len:242 (+) Transcript_39500:275-1000(+)
MAILPPFHCRPKHALLGAILLLLLLLDRHHLPDPHPGADILRPRDRLAHLGAERRVEYVAIRVLRLFGGFPPQPPPIGLGYQLLLGPMKVLLLRPDDAPGPNDAHPPDDLGRCEAKLHHEPHPNQRPRAAQPRLAVHRDRAPLALAEVDEPLDDGVVGHCAVVEVEVKVVKAALYEGGPPVRRRLVEPDDPRDVELREELRVVPRGEGVDPRHHLPRVVARPPERRHLGRQEVHVRVLGVV